MAKTKSYRLREYPQRESWIDRFLNKATPSPQAAIKEKIGAENFAIYQQLLKVNELCSGVQARLPFGFIMH